MPKSLPLALYAALTLILFRAFVTSGDMLFGTDTAALGYFARKFYADIVTGAHAFPFWNPYVQGGLPFVDAMHGDIFYPTTLLSFVMAVHRAIGWKLVIHVFLAGVFMYLWLRRLGISREASLWGGAAYLLAPVLVSTVYAGHDGRLFVSALAPLLFWATDRAVAEHRLAPYAALGGVVALLIFSAHMQLAYFAVWGAVGWALYRLFGWKGPAALLPGLVLLVLLRAALGSMAGLAVFAAVLCAAPIGLAWRRPELRSAIVRFALFAAAGVAGAGLAAVQLVGPACYLGGAPRALCGEAFAYSQRVAKTTEAAAEQGYAYSTSWSLHPEEAFALIVPEFIGANVSTRDAQVETYWGRNAFKLNHEYAGVLGLFLAPILFLVRGARRGTTLFFTALAALALVYSLGATTPLFHLFYALVPGVKLFRGPGGSMFLFALATTTLGALTIDVVRERTADPEFTRRLRTYLWGLVAAAAALALLGSGRALPDLWTALFYHDITPDKARALTANLASITRGVWITFFLAAATAGLVWWTLRGRLTAMAFAGALLLLTAVDEWRVDDRFIQIASPGVLFPADETIRYLQDEQRRRIAPFRVFSAADPNDNMPALYGVEEVQGHHGNEIGRYRELTDGDRLVANNLRVLKLLNAEFILTPQPVQVPGLVPVGQGSQRALYRLEGALPRAFLVDRYEVVPDSLALARLLAPEFDPSRSVILGNALPSDLAPRAGASGTVQWLSSGVNRQVLEVDASGPAMLVVSANFYPAWRARIDGHPAQMVRADFTLRALPLPAGRHQVEFFYRSDLFRRSLALSMACGALLLAVGLVSRARLRRRRGGSEPSA
jgi:hypothetical protein